MLALALVMEGESRETAARQCGMDRQTLRDWVHRYNAMGVAGLFDRPHGGGASPKLTGMQEATLAEWVRAGPDLETDGVVRWRVIDLRQKIAQEFNVELHERSVGKLLRRFAFTTHVAYRKQEFLPVAQDAKDHQQRDVRGLAIDPSPDHVPSRISPNDILTGEVAPHPGLPVGLQLAPYPADHVLADRALEQRPERPLHPSGVGAGEVGGGDQCLDLPGHPGVARQHRALPLPGRAFGARQPGARHGDLDRTERPKQPPSSRSIPTACSRAALVPPTSQCRRRFLRSFPQGTAEPARAALPRSDRTRRPQQTEAPPPASCYSSPWRNLRRRANAGYELSNHSEITPPQFPPHPRRHLATVGPSHLSAGNRAKLFAIQRN